MARNHCGNRPVTAVSMLDRTVKAMAVKYRPVTVMTARQTCDCNDWQTDLLL